MVFTRSKIVWNRPSVGAVAAERPGAPTKKRFRSMLPAVSGLTEVLLISAFTLAVVCFDPSSRTDQIPGVKGADGEVGASRAKDPGWVAGWIFMIEAVEP